MRVFVRAVITGFGFSVGKALYDKMSERLFGESAKRNDDDAAGESAASNGNPQPTIAPG